MAQMSIRATYALDPETAGRIKSLARLWGVSQAEVIRRSVHQAATGAGARMSPADVVAHYIQDPRPLDTEATQARIEAARAQRHADEKHRQAKRGR